MCRVSKKERGKLHGIERDVRKNMYCSTMGCCARRPKLLTLALFIVPDAVPSTLLAAGTDCFSMRAHVR